MGSAASSVLADMGLLEESRPRLLAPPEFDLRAGVAGELLVGKGMRVSVEVLAVDAISEPKRARVRREDTGEVTTVEVLETGDRSSADRDQPEYPLVDPRTTTIFQDYEDSFALINNCWKAPDAKDASAPAAAI